MTGADDTIAMEVPASLEPGTMFADRYRIERALGAGAMGAVYAASDTTLDEPVALKVLRPPAKLSADLLDRFRREVRLARRVTHRNVARTYDIGQLGDLHYLTMELVDGESLDDYRRARGKLPAAEVVKIGIELCEGLAAAHAAGVVHRDLKPANILRGRSGRVVITDFGIARGLVDERDRTMGDGQLVGTPAYMAPEQVEGAELTGQTDLYALGLILYELLTGTQAFDGDSAIAIAMARITRPPPTADALTGVDPGLAAVVVGCLARTPAERPADATAVRDALAALSLGEGLQTGVLATSATQTMPRGVATSAPTGSFVTLNPGQTSVAVLPFRYRGPPEDAYLAEVLTDELVDLLSMTRGLRVPSAGASAPFAEARDPKAVGEALEVDAMIDGSLQRLGPRLRVTARLVNTRTGVQTFSEQVDGTLEDLFELQDRVAKKVAEALRLRLQTPSFSTISPAAAEAYLRARQRSKGYTLGGDGPDGALALYERCLAEAPDFPPAVAGHALATARLWFYLGSQGERDWGAECERSVARALQVAPHLAESHLAAARMHVQRAEYHEAATALQEALTRAPTCAAAHGYLGMLQCEAGRNDEGVRHIELAISLDPAEAPGLFAVSKVLGLRGRFEEAWQALDRLEDSGTGLLQALSFSRMRIAAWAGDRERIVAFRDQFASEPPPAGTWGTTVAGAYLGETSVEELEDAFQRLIATGGSARYWSLMRQLCTEALAYSGRVDAALEHLQHATRDALVDIGWLDACPVLESIRGTPVYEKCRTEVRARAELIWRLN